KLLKGQEMVEAVDKLQGMILDAANGKFTGTEAQLAVLDLLNSAGIKTDLSSQAHNIEQIVRERVEAINSSVSHLEGSARLDATVDASMDLTYDKLVLETGDVTDESAAEIKMRISRGTKRAESRFLKHGQHASDLAGDHLTNRADLLNATSGEAIYATVAALGSYGATRTGTKMLKKATLGLGALGIMG